MKLFTATKLDCSSISLRCHDKIIFQAKLEVNMPTQKPFPGSILSPMRFARVNGGKIAVGGPRKNWTLMIVYREKHCPRCKNTSTC